MNTCYVCVYVCDLESSYSALCPIQWTRDAIQCQLNDSHKSTLPIASSNGHSHPTDDSMLRAAHQLLELSQGRVGVTRSPAQLKPSELETGKHEFKLNGLLRPHPQLRDSDSERVNGDCTNVVDVNGEVCDSVSPEGTSNQERHSEGVSADELVKCEPGGVESMNEEENLGKKCSLNGNGVLINEQSICKDEEEEELCDGLLHKSSDGDSSSAAAPGPVSERKEDRTDDCCSPLPPDDTLASGILSPHPSKTSQSTSPRSSQVDDLSSPGPSQASRSISPRPSQASRSISPRPSQANRSISPRPSQASRSISPRPSQASRSISPRPSQIDDLLSPSLSRAGSLEAVEDMETSNNGGGSVGSEGENSLDQQIGEQPMTVDVKSDSWQDMFGML